MSATQPVIHAALGITGHQELPDTAAWFWVERELRRVLQACLPSRVLSCLAKGADQLFASVALDFGVALEVVVPCEGYEQTFEDAADLTRYWSLLPLAQRTTRLDFPHPSEDAFFAAGKYVVEHVGAMLAVWNGQPARGKGGTGDIVAYALSRGVPVVHLNTETLTVVRLLAE